MVHAEFKGSGNKKIMWYGECDGDARDANFVKRIDHNGNEKVFGSIRVGSDICQIGPNADGVGEIKCTAESEFEDEKEPLIGVGARPRVRGLREGLGAGAADLRAGVEPPVERARRQAEVDPPKLDGLSARAHPPSLRWTPPRPQRAARAARNSRSLQSS